MDHGRGSWDNMIVDGFKGHERNRMDKTEWLLYVGKENLIWATQQMVQSFPESKFSLEHTKSEGHGKSQVEMYGVWLGLEFKKKGLSCR